MQSQYFTYPKGKVLQALRYHFITRKEIRFMIILVNLFAIVSAILFFLKKVSPLSFLTSSVLWFMLMIAFWFVMPQIIYRQSATFKDKFKALLTDDTFTIENENGRRSWKWYEFSDVMESPHFFHLYFNPKSFFLVPKSAFAENEISEAKKMLVEKIKQKQKSQ